MPIGEGAFKVCGGCREPKNVAEFSKDSGRSDGLRRDCKACCRELDKEYYEANREQIRERSEEYREANREQIRERSKKYREANREQIREKKKEYLEANREQIREKRKEYYEANREQIREKSKEYYEANQELYRAKQARKYDLTAEQHQTLLRQVRVEGCPVLQRRNLHPAIDHDHNRPEPHYRAAISAAANASLGLLQESPRAVSNLLFYAAYVCEQPVSDAVLDRLQAFIDEKRAESHRKTEDAYARFSELCDRLEDELILPEDEEPLD